ncbi:MULTISPECIES: type II secretion system F family protein [unclassified Sporosarcina]|uniref:type II secretion system F family protein n=1 Tax=unclassified Sporosarcina TaxID=2647733 RepID=UPI000C165247|nr:MULTISPECIES: type II secretion system F family protein [unclassified Sporosarcina]PID07337.1 type II secretion system protein F [Sporosarcina sp. P30]PID10533.1 type II secretion system protein F [Sporosarcina sp. P31]PID13118.1 type II secretion system protein F [Sporosarcina sp. P32b]
MARFTYEGRDAKAIRRGTVTATNKRDAAIKLKGQGIRVVSLVEQKETVLTKDITIGSPVKRDQLIMFLRQFSTLLQAGVTIVDAVRILSAQVEQAAFRKILTSVQEDLRTGTPLSIAFGKHPKVFEPLILNMVAAGEVSGTVDESLDQLAEHFEKAYRTRQKVTSAMAYPVVVGIIAIAVVIFLLWFVVPMFVDMFDSVGGQLPWLTRAVMAASGWIENYWYLLILIVSAIAVGYILVRNNPKGKYILDTILLKLPIFGSIAQKSSLAMMTRTLSSMFSSSVPILQALTMTERVVGNEVISKVIGESRVSMERGGSLTEPMLNHWAFPPLIPHMIAIGEETGSLDSMLGKVADFYEKEVEAATDRLKALIEPLMIVFLAAIVGTIVLAIMLPMFSMFEQIDSL